MLFSLLICANRDFCRTLETRFSFDTFPHSAAYICVSGWVSIDSDKGLSLARHQVINQISLTDTGTTRREVMTRLLELLYVLNIKRKILLIRAPYARIVIFWHISDIPPMISQGQISCNCYTPPPPPFYIAAIFHIYNWQLVVITHELIYGVRAAIR